MELEKKVISKISEPQDFIKLTNDIFRDSENEKVVLVTIGEGNSVINTHIIDEGNENSVMFSPRTIFNKCFIDNATGYALLHNHPSGDVSPSFEDKYAFEVLRKVSEDVGIRTFDFGIIHENKIYSDTGGGISILRDDKLIASESVVQKQKV